MGERRAWGAPLAALLVLSRGHVSLGLLLQESAHEPTSLGLPLHVHPRLLEALPRLAREHGQGLCISVDGPFMGRLSNTVAMVNGVLNLALATNNSFRFPRFYTKYMEKEHFTDLFGTEPVCTPQDIQVFSPACTQTESRNSNPMMQGRCYMDELRVDMAGRFENSTYCGCKGLVLLDSRVLVWGHSYLDTHSILRQRYWQSFGTTLVSSRPQRPQVAVHMRLGDIENDCEKKYTRYNCNKKLKAEVYCQTLTALLAALPGSCADVSLVTDGKSTSPDVQSVVQCLRTQGVNQPQVITASSMSTRNSFDLLAHADVLVFGASGFGRLAAVVSQSSSARVGEPLPSGQFPSLGFLANTTQLELPAEGGLFTAAAFVKESVARLSKNEAIKALKATCSAAPSTHHQAADMLPQLFLQDVESSIERDIFES